MNDRSGYDKLYTLMADVLGVEPSLLTNESSPESVAEWDSLNHLMLITAIEAEFDVKVSVDEAVAMRSVALIREFLRSRGAV